MASQAGVLTRHFFWRFFDNDLVSPDTDIHETAAFLLAFLVAPCVLEVPGLAFKYGNVFTPPLKRIDMIIGDQLGYVSWSMLVAALVTTLVWDAMSLDTRDHAILGPLPIAARDLLWGKLRAIGLFLLALVGALNAASVIAFPMLCLGPRATVDGVAALVAGHAVATVGAALFGCFVALALRGVFLNLLGPAWYGRLALPLQFVFAFGCLAGYLSVTVSPVAQSGRAMFYWPPLWFLGLYQTISPRVVAGIAVAHEAAFQQLANVALVAMIASALVALALYFAGHLRYARHRPQPFAGGSTAHRLFSRASVVFARALIRHPVGRATWLFTVQTIARSARHRLCVAGYVLVGCGLCYLVIASLQGGAVGQWAVVPSPRLLAIQSILSLALVVGVRAAFATPGEVKAAWLFRLTAGGEVRRRPYIAGIRRATVACFVVPLLAALLPVHILLWGTRTALAHALCGFLCAAILTEFLLLRVAKLPFVCARAAGKNRLLFRWPAYLLVFLLYTFGFANLEYAAIRSHRVSDLLIGLALSYAAVVVYRSLRYRRATSFVFEESPEGATTLSL